MIASILNHSIRHRFIIILMTLAVAGYGFYSLQRLPIDAVPDITNNQVQINALAPGFSPFEVEKQVTFPIESALNGIDGLESTRSISRNGFSQITAIFEENVDVYFARQQINERLMAAKEVLPPNIDPEMGPISTGLGEIYMWSVQYQHPKGIGATVRAGQPGWQHDGSYLTPEGHFLKTDIELASYLRTVQDWIIRPQLRGIKSLAEVDSIGGFVRQYHVEVHPEKLISLGISLNDVIEALEKGNQSIGAGYIERNSQSYVVRADSRVKKPQEILELVVATRKGGSPIRIRDIAAVSLGKEMRTGSATSNGEEVVIGTAMMLIGGNSRTVSQAVDVRIKEINRTLPPDIIAKTILNRSKLVDATIKTVSWNLAEGALLVIIILFALLGNFRAAFITACVIPLSMLITATGMVATKISGNLMSLGALDFGLIVDGAIIIAENCLQKLTRKQHELGRVLSLNERLKEVSRGAKEMIQPTVFGQAIIITVYLPLLTFTDVEEKMFQPMAATVIYALIGAFVLSLTFVPAAIALFVTGKVNEEENILIRLAKSLYTPVLDFNLKKPGLAIVTGLALIAGSGVLYQQLGQEFVPTLDEQDLALHAVRIPSTSLTQSTAMQRTVEKTLLEFPEIDYVFSKTGTAEMASDPMPPNVSDTFVMLKPRSQWPEPYLSKLNLIEKMETRLFELPGNNYEFTQPIEMRFNELIGGVRSDVAVKIYGDDFAKMQKLSKKIARSMAKIPGTADLKIDQTDGLPLMEMHVNTAMASRLGIKSGEILEFLAVAIGGGKVGEILEGDRRFDLIVKLPESLRNDPVALASLPLSFGTQENGRGYLPLREVVKIELTEGVNEVTRENGKRMLTVQTNVRGTDLGSYVTAAKEVLEKEVSIPAGYWLEWGGQFEHLISARNHLLVVIPICFTLIFILLYSAFHSIRHALLVFTGVPMALTGGIFMLWWREMPFSISAAVGFIALSGIAVLNGLVMLTSIQQKMRAGLNREIAIREGALQRLRPVLMTALVASLGFIPMAMATGTGAEVQKPLASVVIGGLVSATVLTLLILPALCRWFLPKEDYAPEIIIDL